MDDGALTTGLVTYHTGINLLTPSACYLHFIRQCVDLCVVKNV